MATYSHQQDKQLDTISLTNGYWFYFEVDGNDIAVFASAWSGRETVFLNDEINSNRRNLFGFEGKHGVVINDTEYTIVISMENMLTGTVACKLMKGRKVLDEQSKGYIKGMSARSLFSKLILYVLAGYGAGTMAVQLVRLFVEK